MNLFQIFGTLLTTTGNLLEQNNQLTAKVAELEKLAARVAELEKANARIPELEAQIESLNGALQKQ